MRSVDAGVGCYNTHMSTSISALQRNAAAVIRRVSASGLVEEITDRGRVVAVLGPPPAVTGLERLRQQGAVIEPKPGGLAEILNSLDSLPAADLMGALEEQRDTDR